MTRANSIRSVLLMIGMAVAIRASGQTVVDRLAVRVDYDVILESEVRDLGLYQQLLNGSAERRDKRLSELIEQWIVKTEATSSQFPRPTDEDANQAVVNLQKQFSSPQEYSARLRELGLSPAAVRAILVQQLFVSRYLEYKFRPVVQVDSAALEKYYREEFVPAMQSRGQTAPGLETVRDQIRELLVQQEINKLAAQWIEESKSHLKTEVFSADEKNSAKKVGK